MNDFSCVVNRKVSFVVGLVLKEYVAHGRNVSLSLWFEATCMALFALSFCGFALQNHHIWGY